LVGAGKASAAMARAFETAWPGDKQGAARWPRRDPARPRRSVRAHSIVEASHPVPDKAGEQAARDILELAAVSDRTISWCA
jgi:glycerate-2-kinase